MNENRPTNTDSQVWSLLPSSQRKAPERGPAQLKTKLPEASGQTGAPRAPQRGELELSLGSVPDPTCPLPSRFTLGLSRAPKTESPIWLLLRPQQREDWPFYLFIVKHKWERGKLSYRHSEGYLPLGPSQEGGLVFSLKTGEPSRPSAPHWVQQGSSKLAFSRPWRKKGSSLRLKNI